MKKLTIIFIIFLTSLFISSAVWSNTFLPFCKKDSNYRNNCSGKYTFSNGVYDGNWLSNKPHGKGSFLFNTGALYKGEFQNGKLHGKGVKTYRNLTKLKGKWSKGVYVSNKAPANSYTDGSGWKCNSGFSRDGNICSKNKNRSSSSSSCKKNGYIKSGNRCIKAYVPKNAKWAFNHWRCDSGYTKSGNGCIKKSNSKKSSYSKKSSSGDLFKNIVTILSILGDAASTATEGLPSKAYNPVTPSFKSNSNSNNSSGYKSSFGNTYKYDLSKQSDRIKYQSDRAAQLLDGLGSQYIRELENNLGEFGGGKQ